MTSIQLVLPWPPSVNHYWVASGHRRFISKRGLQFREEVQIAALGVQKIEGPVGIVILAYPPDKRKRDLDNILKGILDSLQHAGVFDDDNQISRLAIERRYPDRAENIGKLYVRILQLQYID